jgi:hypothetical protein
MEDIWRAGEHLFQTFLKMPKVNADRTSTAQGKVARSPIAKTKDTHAFTDKTIEHATRLLDCGPMLHRELAIFGVSVLRELCKTRNIQVSSSGRKGDSIRKDYVKALYAYVSFNCVGRVRPLTKWIRNPEQID